MVEAEQDWVRRDREESEREHARKCARILKTPELLHGVYENCGIAPEFWNAKPEDFPQGRVASAIETLEKGKRRSLYLFGKEGRGKTHFSCAVCLDFIRMDLISASSSICFTSLTSILSRIRNSYDSKEESEENIHWELSHYFLLVLDDIGRERSSAFSRETLFRIADTRKSWNRATIYITDKSYVRMFNELFNPETMSRIYHNLIHFKGRDRRQSQQETVEIQS